MMLRQSLMCAVSLALLGAAVPARALDLPDGPGKATVAGVCGGCHDIDRLGAGYTPDGWRSVTHMMHNFGAPVPEEDWPVVTDYLIKSFPEKPKPAANII
ncbi:MAG TPA: hypothetical protein VGH49_19145, partial [Xanthobacteraceae bacterium]